MTLVLVFFRLALCCIFSSSTPLSYCVSSLSEDWSELRPDLDVSPFIGISGEQGRNVSGGVGGSYSTSGGKYLGVL